MSQPPPAALGHGVDISAMPHLALQSALRHGSAMAPGGLPLEVQALEAEGATAAVHGDLPGLRLRIEAVRLRLLRGFDDLLCLEGLDGVDHLPHQIETVRRVLRQFRGRVLLADEVGLGKTIEACLLLREYLLRGLARRVLILVPANLVPQWQSELSGKFHLQFTTADPQVAARDGFWAAHPLILSAITLARSRRHARVLADLTWDLVVVDEAHHCRRSSTRSFQLVNSLRLRYCFLLSATPVQNDLMELHALLTLLEPGHLRTEADFKKRFVTRGNPRDPRNREMLRELLGQVMIRNTRSLVAIDLPPRYAQTLVVEPTAEEARAYRQLDTYVRWRLPRSVPADDAANDPEPPAAGADSTARPETVPPTGLQLEMDFAAAPALPASAPSLPRPGSDAAAAARPAPLSRMQVNHLLLAAGSHPAALLGSVRRILGDDPQARPLIEALEAIRSPAKERRLLELLRTPRSAKILVFAASRETVEHLHALLEREGLAHALFHGGLDAEAKSGAMNDFRERVGILLCTEAGGEGHNLQFCDTLINVDLPWNPMRIEQRIGRIHRYGQTRPCFIFNLCTRGSLEERLLVLLGEKIRMFELVVGEVGSILGNLDGGEEFESLVLDLWMGAGDAQTLDQAFDQLGTRLLDARGAYDQTKQLDEALFGDDFE